MHKLDDLFPYDVLVTVLKLDVSHNIKSAASRLLMCLHIDRDPQATSKIPRLTRTWSDVTNSESPNLPYVDAGRSYTFGLVQQLVSDHIKNMKGMYTLCTLYTLLYILYTLYIPLYIPLYTLYILMNPLYSYIPSIPLYTLSTVPHSHTPSPPSHTLYLDTGQRWDDLSRYMLNMLKTLVDFNFYGTNDRLNIYTLYTLYTL